MFEDLQLRGHVKALLDFIEALFGAGKPCTGYAREFFDAIADVAFRGQAFDDLVKVFFGEFHERKILMVSES